MQLESPTDISSNLINVLTLAGDKILPNEAKKNVVNAIWKTDTDFNKLLNERQNYEYASEDYKRITKVIKKRIKHLRNMKLNQEAEEINETASHRKVEELYRCMKTDITKFKKKGTKLVCDPGKLTEYFKDHFNSSSELLEPIELIDVPDYIKQLQSIDVSELNTSSPSTDEIQSTVNKLNNCKSATDIPAAYIKHAINCKGFIVEMEKLYKTIWMTNKYPNNWSESKLIAIWKGTGKGMIQQPIVDYKLVLHYARF